MEWVETRERLIGFIDIMGFKNLVALESHDLIHGKLKIIALAKKEIADLSKDHTDMDSIKIITFSDSILIVSNDDSPVNLIYFQGILAFIYIKCIENNIPIKGAVAYGKFTANYEESIFFGQPLIDAFLLQEELQSYSIIAHHTYEKYINMSIEIEKKATQIEKKRWIRVLVKLKGGSSYHNLLNWTMYISGIKDLPIRQEYEEILLNFYNSVSGIIRRYVDNTLEIYHQFLLEE